MYQPVPIPDLLPHSLSSNGRRVVLVDDDPTHLLVWEVLLRHAGYDVVACADGQQALRAIARGCDCVLTDYNMPGMDGLELIRRARRQGRRPAFIVLTGSAAEDIQQAAREAGASRVLQKPAPAQLVLDHIAQLR